MTGARTLPMSGMALLAALFCLAIFALEARGYGSASNLDLWGRALLAKDGLISLEDSLTAYPPLPYVGTIALSAIFPFAGSATPEMLAVILGAALATAWFRQLRKTGFSLVVSLAVTALATINPLFLRAVGEGPGFVMLHWGIWLLALGMFNLRRGQQVNDVILVSVALILISLSHPFGLIIALAVLPFLALVVPPQKLRDAPFGVSLVLLFPLLFTLAGFAYVNLVFAGDPLHFIDMLSRETASLGPEVAVSSSAALPIGIAAMFALIATSPIAIAMVVATRRLPPLSLAAFGLLGTLVTASALAALIDILPPISLVASLGVTVALACAICWPRSMVNEANILKLLCAGLIASITVLLADPAPETGRWRTALLGESVAAPDDELAGLGKALSGRRAVLFDAEAAPTAVAVRGAANGLWTADTPQFQLSGIRQNLDADTVVVRARHSLRGSDKVGQSFPDLFESGAEGYRLLFDGANWRAYARIQGAPS